MSDNSYVSRKAVIDIIHKVMYKFFDEDSNDKDELLLSINKELTNAIRHLPKISRPDNVLNKIEAEILEEFSGCYICEWDEDYDWDENDISDYIGVGNINDILRIIDKYKGRG